MIKIFKITSAAAIDQIAELLNPLEEFKDNANMAGALKSMLLDSPERCFFVVVVDEEKVLGFLLAFLDRGNVAKILQTYALDASVGKSLDVIFMRLLLWCEERNVEEVRLETRRNAIELANRWKFKQLSLVMNLDVPSAVESVLLEGQKNLGEQK